ncbi:MAG: DNA polymerase I [Myxococcales bacterium]|nr:DNA polymerase I [Myxococcales bacterium]
MNQPLKQLLLIDGSGYIFRAFFAIRSLTTSTGLPTNAVYGVATMLDKTLRELQPADVAVCFDTKAKTFRHELFPDYKANRPEPPAALVPQFALIHELVRLRGLPMLTLDGWEADDLIGTLARQAAAADFAVTIVSGDKDLMQLVTDRVRIYDPMKDKWFGPAEVRERFGVPPERVIDVLGLAGDSSDNIPGVPGVGEKTAIKLMAEYGDLEAVLAAAGGIKGKLGEKLALFAAQARLSRELATIRTDAPLPVDAEHLTPGEPDIAGLRALYEKLEFHSQLAALPQAATATIDRDRYRTVLTENDLRELVKKLAAAPGFAFDTETNSLSPTAADLVGLSFCCDEAEAFYVPVGHRYLGMPAQLPRERVLEALRPLLTDPAKPKWGQNAKYDLLVLENYGLRVAGLAGDTMIADYLLAPGRGGHSLDALAQRWLGHTTIKFGDVTGSGRQRRTFDEVDLDNATRYAAEDAHVTWLLHERIENELRRDEPVWKLYREMELPLIDVLAAMERAGVAIDVPYFAALAVEMDERIQRVAEKIQAAAGEAFNLNSPAQIGQVLFERLGIKGTKKTKTGYSTDAQVLEKLAEEGHEVPRLLLEYRGLAKLKGTYVDALPKLINPRTGRIHTSFNQTIAATGRLSSSDPNLQNIPIRGEDGRRIRQGFVPAPGKRFLAADYSQIELRLAAHLSGDELMIAAFRAGEDVHTRTAAEIMGVFPALVTPEMRSAAKTVNFGVLYGMSAFRLGRDLGIGTKKAQEFIDHYFARYPKLKGWLEATVREAHEKGGVRTLFGRWRPLPELDSPDANVRAGAERAAINTPVQGAAADLIKLAMLRLHERIRAEKLPLSMILQVHDELVFEVDPEAQDRCREVIRREMENVLSLSVPLVVEINGGDNWREAH